MPGARSERFPALTHRDFRVLWYGMLFASGTMAFQYYAQMWLIYDLTDSAWVLGALGAVRGLATLLFGLYGGALADRMDRRKLLLLTQTISMLVNMSIGLLVISGAVQLWLVFVLIFVGSATASLDAPVRQALLPELVPQQHIPNAVALTTAAQMGSFAVTPVLAGYVIAGLGSGGAYLLSTIGNVGVLVALWMLHYRGRSTSARHEPLLLTIRRGIDYGRRQPIILWIICLNFVTAAFGMALYNGLITKWAGDVLLLDPAGYGLLASTWGVGTLAASFTLSYMGEIRHLGRILILGSLFFGVSFLLFGLTRSLPVAGFAYLINGIAWTAASIASTAIIQSIVPNEVRGRVMSLFMINGAVANMNSLVLGGVADQIGMELLLPGSSLLCSVLVVLLVMTVPVLRRLDHILDQLRAAKT
ncbi:MAG: MFS transporter [Pseudomonadales bacterium]|nr:MFS transporter [Pseudomonadales bacterium]HJN52749.1 MFS transporter [Pseudomonadales bacterium]